MQKIIGLCALLLSFCASNGYAAVTYYHVEDALKAHNVLPPYKKYMDPNKNLVVEGINGKSCAFKTKKKSRKSRNCKSSGECTKTYIRVLKGEEFYNCR